VVVLYTLFGGFLAVSLTDFVQGCIMFAALVLVPIVVVIENGGVGATLTGLEQLNPELLNIFHQASWLGIISTMAWGLGYFGQPHIIVRFMAIKSVKQLPSATRIGMSWMLVTVVGAVVTSLAGIVYVANTQVPLSDPETIFIVLSQWLFHPLIVGFLLAAILAAIMSTISSQLLVTSSSLTSDFYHTFLNKQASDRQLVFVGRLSVLVVSLVAIYLAYDRSNTILGIVSNAWAGFGAAFGPVVILSLYWHKMTRTAALAGMITGAVTVLVWIYAPIQINGQSLSQWLYEIVPGFVMNTLVIIVISQLKPQQQEQVKATFQHVNHLH
jgi:SSS family solute:Na+ symporter/sodium/proline symporter